MPPSAAFLAYSRTRTPRARNAARLRKLCVLIAAFGLGLFALVCLSVPH